MVILLYCLGLEFILALRLSKQFNDSALLTNVAATMFCCGCAWLVEVGLPYIR